LISDGTQLRSLFSTTQCLSAVSSPSLTQVTCVDAINQIFDLKLQPDLTFLVKSLTPGRCLARSTTTATLQLATCDGSAAQKWTLPVRR
jgi:hypothetical protein